MYVLCKLPHAGEKINGVAFRALPGVGVVSVEQVPEALAERFARIPGYELLESLPKTAKGEPAAAAAEPAAEAEAPSRRRRAS